MGPIKGPIVYNIYLWRKTMIKEQHDEIFSKISDKSFRESLPKLTEIIITHFDKCDHFSTFSYEDFHVHTFTTIVCPDPEGILGKSDIYRILSNSYESLLWYDWMEENKLKNDKDSLIILTSMIVSEFDQDDTFTVTEYTDESEEYTVVSPDKNGTWSKSQIFDLVLYEDTKTIYWKPDEVIESLKDYSNTQQSTKYQYLINILNALVLIESTKRYYNHDVDKYLKDINEAFFNKNSEESRNFIEIIRKMYCDFNKINSEELSIDDCATMLEELCNRLRGATWMI